MYRFYVTQKAFRMVLVVANTVVCRIGILPRNGQLKCPYKELGRIVTFVNWLVLMLYSQVLPTIDRLVCLKNSQWLKWQKSWYGLWVYQRKTC